MRTCVWCDAPRPSPPSCGPSTATVLQCYEAAQRHSIWHKQMKRDADSLADPYWRAAYGLLRERYKWVELRLQERLADLDEKQQWREYYQKKREDMQLDYIARLRALGMSDEDIAEFEAFWKAQQRPSS